MKWFLFLFAMSHFAIAETSEVYHFKLENSKLAQPSEFSVQFSEVQVKRSKDGRGFSEVRVPGILNSQAIGAPSLPVKTWVLVGKPSDLKISVVTRSENVIKNLKPIPAQHPDCRCKVEKKPFAFSEKAYGQKGEAVTLSYLGAFRGTPMTQVMVRLASYDKARNAVIFKNDLTLRHNSKPFEFGRGVYKDYLIVAPQALAKGTDEFVKWKKSLGFNVTVEALTQQQMGINNIQNLIKAHYAKGIDFVMLIGGEYELPMFDADTTGDSQTPSDLKYYTMDGDEDYVPDMFGARIVAATAEEVARQLSKSIQFEKKDFSALDGFGNFIGIASNEGSDPSDNEYVKSIGDKFAKVVGAKVTHLYQDDTASTPKTLNSKFSKGSLWLTYLGHGSGTEWPSMYQSYNTTHIPQMANMTVVKPIVIDVACMNGKLIPNYLGSTFLSTKMNNGTAFGAVAYYGGSVNISWHPPAVMAQGIAFEHLEKNFNHLGEALLAGQIYLSKNWSSPEDVVDNFEWYHLQGDPGLNIKYQ